MRVKRYTERMSFTVSHAEKVELIAETTRRGISLGELIRRATAGVTV